MRQSLKLLDARNTEPPFAHPAVMRPVMLAKGPAMQRAQPGHRVDIVGQALAAVLNVVPVSPAPLGFRKTLQRIRDASDRDALFQAITET